jgi:hypothetical protein
MNILLWVFQAMLALLCLAGGSYKVFQFDELAKQLNAIPRSGWSVFGVIEMICAILLIVPGATKWMPALTPIAAAALSLEALTLAAVYAHYSLQLSPQNPLVWSVAIALLAAVVAYGRYAVKPLA